MLSGELVSGGIAKQGIELAYRATGQDVSGPNASSAITSWSTRIAERFDKAGFTLSHIAEPCGKSFAHVFIAEKTS